MQYVVHVVTHDLMTYWNLEQFTYYQKDSRLSIAIFKRYLKTYFFARC